MACCRELTITLVSAQQLPDVRSFGKMKVYAQVTFNGVPETLQKTPTDEEGRTNPKWNFPIAYTLSESAIQNPGSAIVITLLCQRTFGHDKFVGSVNVSIKSLFERGLRSDDGMLWYEVAGTSGGRLFISYSFGERTTVPLERPPKSSVPRWIKVAGMIGVTVLVKGTLYLIFGDDFGFDLGCGGDELPDDAAVGASGVVFFDDA